MAMSGSVTGSSDGDRGGRSRVAIVLASIVRFTEEGPSASLSLRRPGFGLPSSSVAALISEVPGAVGTTIERRRDFFRDRERPDRITGEYEDSGGPVFSRTGLEEEGRFGVSEGVRSWRATVAGGEVEERGGADVDVLEVELGVGITKLTMSRIARAAAGPGEVKGMRGLSMGF
ncbi:hypothetical protein EDB83DRAFT_2317790 [Lactarius deliciosus]|nr:hypothetical protein EDB83DRAFT_2317790 [Lactarius deliciosus]